MRDLMCGNCRLEHATADCWRFWRDAAVTAEDRQANAERAADAATRRAEIAESNDRIRSKEVIASHARLLEVEQAARALEHEARVTIAHLDEHRAANDMATAFGIGKLEIVTRAREDMATAFGIGKLEVAANAVRALLARGESHEETTPPHHVCGLQGFGKSLDDGCPACRAFRVQAAGRDEEAP